MWTDTIVDEVHAVRQRLMAEVNGDVASLARRGEQLARDMGLQFVTSEPRRPTGWNVNSAEFARA